MKATQKYTDYRASKFFVVMNWEHTQGECVEVVDYSNDKADIQNKLLKFDNDFYIIENNNYTINHGIIKELSK